MISERNLIIHFAKRGKDSSAFVLGDGAAAILIDNIIIHTGGWRNSPELVNWARRFFQMWEDFDDIRKRAAIADGMVSLDTAPHLRMLMKQAGLLEK